MHKSRLKNKKRKSNITNSDADTKEDSLDTIVSNIKKNLQRLVDIEKSVYSDY